VVSDGGTEDKETNQVQEFPLAILPFPHRPIRFGQGQMVAGEPYDIRQLSCPLTLQKGLQQLKSQCLGEHHIVRAYLEGSEHNPDMNM